MAIKSAKALRLQSWLSPAFPTGAYGYSHGIERAVEAGWIGDRASLVDWLAADLAHGTLRCDAHFFAAAWRAAVGRDGGASLVEVAELAAAWRGTAELALESGAQGSAFLATVRKAWPHPRLDAFADDLGRTGVTPVLPVAAAAACAAHGIALDGALPLYLQAAAANLVNAGVRLIPLGQTDGQLAVAALERPAAEAARAASAAAPDDLGSAALMVEIASMQHETQRTRLFRS
jgi:urease accessory protein